MTFHVRLTRSMGAESLHDIDPKWVLGFVVDAARPEDAVIKANEGRHSEPQPGEVYEATLIPATTIVHVDEQGDLWRRP